ncbi:MAG: leucine-rich repeat domain-containing protein [Candidatus Hermodarchaeota archaeon]
MKEFRVNDFITLRLERNHTVIYIEGKKFLKCKRLLINIPFDKESPLNSIDSIDDLSEFFENEISNEQRIQKFEIPPEVEFWGHCSNLQAWYQHDYNTRILKSDLAFPLLKKLVDLGDPLAKRVFKEELTSRLLNGNFNVMLFLLNQNYLQYFKDEEKEILLDYLDTNIKRITDDFLADDKKLTFLGFKKVREFATVYPSKLSENLYLYKLISIIKSQNVREFEYLLKRQAYNYFLYKKEGFNEIFSNVSASILEHLIKLLLARYPLVVETKYGEEINLVYLADEFFHYIRDLPPSFLNKWLIDVIPDLSFKTIRFMLRKGFFRYLTYEDIRYLNKRPDFILANFYVEFNNEVFFIDEYTYGEKDYLAPHSSRSMEWLYNLELERLYLSIVGRGIKDIKQIKGLEKMKNLEYLDLKGNKIENIDGFDYLTNLRFLDLSKNNISDLKGLNIFHNLRILNLSKNNLNSLPDSVGMLEELRKLKLANNNLQELPKTLNNLKKLEIIDLSFNNFNSFPSILCELKSLKEIHLKGSNLKDLPEGKIDIILN